MGKNRRTRLVCRSEPMNTFPVEMRENILCMRILSTICVDPPRNDAQRMDNYVKNPKSIPPISDRSLVQILMNDMFTYKNRLIFLVYVHRERGNIGGDEALEYRCLDDPDITIEQKLGMVRFMGHFDAHTEMAPSGPVMSIRKCMFTVLKDAKLNIGHVHLLLSMVNELTPIHTEEVEKTPVPLELKNLCASIALSLVLSEEVDVD